MKRRKTFDVKMLVDKLNERLENSTCSPAERNAMSSVVESVLHDTGNYGGYCYPAYADGEKFDESRRYYFFKP